MDITVYDKLITDGLRYQSIAHKLSIQQSEHEQEIEKFNLIKL